MAKADKTKLETAREELKKAQETYERLVRQDTAKLTEGQKQKHSQACREALTAKREAKKTVDALKRGK